MRILEIDQDCKLRQKLLLLNDNQSCKICLEIRINLPALESNTSLHIYTYTLLENLHKNLSQKTLA